MNNIKEKLLPKKLSPEKRANLESYMLSISNLKTMLDKGIITEKDFYSAESLLAKKYCINNLSIYRPNDLIKTPFRAMYIHSRKEV